MTTVSSIRELDDCLDSTIVKEFVVAPKVDEDVMRAMVDGGRLQFFPRFPRPYFRIEKERAYVIQGIVGNDRFRVTFSPSAAADTEARLRRLIERECMSIAEPCHG
jgi:hypothetical protein